MWMHRIRWLAAGTLLALAAACGGGGGDAGTGTLRLALTDNPGCGYDAVNVTVERVRVHQSSGAGSDDGGWQEVVLATPKTLDLLNLTNGVLEELGQTALPAGTYSQLRLVLSPNTGGQADRNWVVLTGSGAIEPLKTPSGQQSGLKVDVGITVAADQLTDVVLDFDACKSVVVAGNSGQYLLKPVLRVIPRAETGVIGEVSPALATAGATVSLQQDGVVRRATVAAGDGGFKLQPVEPGTYTLVVVTPGHATAVVRDVVVGSGQLVRVAPAGEDIDPPVSGVGTLEGTVTTGQAAGAIDAEVVVLQALTGGPTVRLTDQRVDADTGAYRRDNLAVEAPQVAAFAAGASLGFAPDAAAAGLFRLRATAGIDSDTVDLPLLGAGQTGGQDFTFP